MVCITNDFGSSSSLAGRSSRDKSNKTDKWQNLAGGLVDLVHDTDGYPFGCCCQSHCKSNIQPKIFKDVLRLKLFESLFHGKSRCLSECNLTQKAIASDRQLNMSSIIFFKFLPTTKSKKKVYQKTKEIPQMLSNYSHIRI